MASTTTNNGATVDNLNVLDTITADNTGGAEIIELQDVANALFPKTNATQTLTIDSAFWTGNLKLTFQVGNTGIYYTLTGTSYNSATSNRLRHEINGRRAERWRQSPLSDRTDSSAVTEVIDAGFIRAINTSTDKPTMRTSIILRRAE